MSVVKIGGLPFAVVGHAGSSPMNTAPGTFSSIIVDAVNEAAIFIGQIFWDDYGSHTVDTSGSSSINWRSVVAVFANAGTSVIVGIAPVDAGNGPAPRASNASDIISFDVFRTLTGGGGGIANGGFNTSAPTSGTKTIAHGDVVAVAVQMTARGGADSVSVGYSNHQSGSAAFRPSVSNFTGGAYGSSGGIPGVVLIASDGTRGFFFGGSSLHTTTSTAFNSGSSPNERGNVMVLPFAGKIHGLLFSVSVSANTADFDMVLYSDPLGTPVAQKTVSIDANTIGAVTTAGLHSTVLFSSPYTFAAGDTLAAIFKPTTVNSITPVFITLANSNDMKGLSLGTNAYAVNRSSGAFGVQNSNLERYNIGLIISDLDDGTGGGSGGFPVLGGPFT